MVAYAQEAKSRTEGRYDNAVHSEYEDGFSIVDAMERWFKDYCGSRGEDALNAALAVSNMFDQKYAELGDRNFLIYVEFRDKTNGFYGLEFGYNGFYHTYYVQRLTNREWLAIWPD